MSKSEIIKRYSLFIVSLFFIGQGIAFSKHAGLGISPISSVANVVSLKFPVLSLGSWLIVSNLVFVVGQILLLRRNFKKIQFLQIPLSFLFGFFTDLGLKIAGLFQSQQYWQQFVFVVVGSFTLAFGIALNVTAGAVYHAPEGFVKTLAVVLNKKFSNVKIIFDSSWVLLSVILSMLFFNGQILGVREGTVISAFLVGFFVKLVSPPIKKFFKKVVVKEQ